MWSGLLTLLSPPGSRARLSILIFHRVLPQPDPLFPDEMHAERFDEICAWLAGGFNVLPMDQAVDRLRRGDLPARALAITFDDGYADNHDVALPILQRHRLPAAFYIATGFLDGGRMWNDTVIEAMRLAAGRELDLAGLGLEGVATLPLGDTDQRRASIQVLLRALKYRPPEQRLELVQRVAERAGAALPNDLMMRSDQVKALHSAGMLVGAHTHSHPILGAMDKAAARREIELSRQRLEALLGESVRHFAYPNGVPGCDFTDETADLVSELGFDSAVTTGWGAARGSTDLFRLPRFTPWDRTPGRFAARIARNLWSS